MAPLIRVVERLIAPLRRRVMLMVGRGVVRLVDDRLGRQRVQIEALSGEILDDVERCQEYGFTSCPPPGSDAIVLALGGMRQHPVAVSVESPEHRAARGGMGEVVLYTYGDRRRAGGRERHMILLNPHRRRIFLQTRNEADAGAIVEIQSGDTPSARIKCGRSSITLTDAGITMRAPRIDRQRVT